MNISFKFFLISYMEIYENFIHLFSHVVLFHCTCLGRSLLLTQIHTGFNSRSSSSSSISQTSSVMKISGKVVVCASQLDSCAID